MHQHHHHDLSLIILSVLIAIFASYTALDLANSVTSAKGRIKWIWLLGGSLAMGVGIWSMHFIGMLAFHVDNLNIYYDVPLLILSILVAILASALALYIVSSRKPTLISYSVGSAVMGTAIAGMHYIGIWSMRMNAYIEWDFFYVFLSILVAFIASGGALFLAFTLREDQSIRGFAYRGAGGAVMGCAIAGMHYTAMAAMTIVPLASRMFVDQSDLLATDGLAAAVIVGTIFILGVALTGSNIERALSRRTLINEALQASIKARDDFFSIASHELKTPLTSIRLQNDLIIRNIKNQKGDEEKIIAMLDRSGKNIDRINRLVDDMLDISRMATGKLSLQKEKFVLNHLIKEVVERLKPLLDETKTEVVVTEEAEVCGEWDRFRIEQVFTNLLTNAGKYAPGKEVVVTLRIESQMGVVSVKDQGKGIAPDDQERIFKRFERAEKAGDTRGLGLGLFITREIILMHKGEIVLKSEIDKGSEFIVRLPIEA